MRLDKLRNKSIWLFLCVTATLVFAALLIFYVYELDGQITSLITKILDNKEQNPFQYILNNYKELLPDSISSIVFIILFIVFWVTSILKSSYLLGQSKVISEINRDYKSVKWLVKLERLFLFFAVTIIVSWILNIVVIFITSTLFNKNKQLNKIVDNDISAKNIDFSNIRRIDIIG